MSIDHIDEQPRVRVRVLEFLDDSLDGNHFADVELRRKMVREHRRRRKAQRCHESNRRKFVPTAEGPELRTEP